MLRPNTPSTVTISREELNSTPHRQGRREEGHRVFFGISDKVHNKDGTNHEKNNEEDDNYHSTCLKGRIDTLFDMYLISHARHSFSQTAPMSLTFGNHQQKVIYVKWHRSAYVPRTTTISTTGKIERRFNRSVVIATRSGVAMIPHDPISTSMSQANQSTSF